MGLLKQSWKTVTAGPGPNDVAATPKRGTAPVRQHVDEVLDFLVDLSIVGNCRRDLGAQQLSKSATEPMDGHSERSLRHVEGPGQLRISALFLLAGQKAFHPFKQDFLTGLDDLGA